MRHVPIHSHFNNVPLIWSKGKTIFILCKKKKNWLKHDCYVSLDLAAIFPHLSNTHDSFRFSFCIPGWLSIPSPPGPALALFWRVERIFNIIWKIGSRRDFKAQTIKCFICFILNGRSVQPPFGITRKLKLILSRFLFLPSLSLSPHAEPENNVQRKYFFFVRTKNCMS